MTSMKYYSIIEGIPEEYTKAHIPSIIYLII
jgi:hypothetical protein